MTRLTNNVTADGARYPRSFSSLPSQRPGQPLFGKSDRFEKTTEQPSKAPVLLSEQAKQAPAKRPRVIVVDDFTQHRIKLLEPQTTEITEQLHLKHPTVPRIAMSHGQVICHLIQALNPHLEVEKLPIANPHHLLPGLKRLQQRLDKGEPVDAVNLSLGNEFDMAFLGELTGLPLTPENLAEMRPALRQWLEALPNHFDQTVAGWKQLFQAEFTDELADELKVGFLKTRALLHAIEDVTAKGVPVYIAAGNNGPDDLNLLSLANGVTVVGATDSHGHKESYSGDNTLISRFAQGTYNVTPVQAQKQWVGFDLLGQGHQDIVLNRPRRAKSLPHEAFVGKSKQEVVLSPAEIERLRQQALQAIDEGNEPPAITRLVPSLHKRLFKVDEAFLALHGLYTSRAFEPSASLVEALRAEVGGDYCTWDMAYGYREDKAGKLIYDPANTGRSGAVHAIWGTSLATPTALANDLKSKPSQG